MKIQTKFCPVCHTAETLEVDPQEYRAWQRGALIQNAFPGLNKDQRERLKTGLHGKCWNIHLGTSRWAKE